MLMSTLGGHLLGNMLHGLTRNNITRAVDGTPRATEIFYKTSFFNLFWNSRISSQKILI